MGQTREERPSTEHETCRCGEYWIGPDAPHTVHGMDRAHVTYQVMGAPQYGREAHTVRECYREVCADESWPLALKEWKISLAAVAKSEAHGCAFRFPLPSPMPVGHLMFSPVPGSAALSRKDNAARNADGAE